MTLRERVAALPIVDFWSRFSAAGPGILAAGVAYNVFFAVFPLAVAALGFAALAGQDSEVRQTLDDFLFRVAPPEVAELVLAILDDVVGRTGTQQVVLIAGGLLVALWSAARGANAIIKVLTTIEGMADQRNWLWVRLEAVLLTFAAAAAFILAIVLLVIGDSLAEWLGDVSGQDWVIPLWERLSLPVAAIGLYLFLYALYRFGPPLPLPGAWLGALVGTGGILLASVGLGWLLRRTGSLGGAYGSLTSIAVVLIWLYLSAWIILLAASSAAEFERSRTRGVLEPAESQSIS